MIDPVTALSLGIRPTGLDAFKGVNAATANSDAAAVGSFKDVMADIGASTMEKLNVAESTSIEALRGNAAPREVAEAMMSAEQSLQMAVAVRDKIVTAYLEVSRMAI